MLLLRPPPSTHGLAARLLRVVAADAGGSSGSGAAAAAAAAAAAGQQQLPPPGLVRLLSQLAAAGPAALATAATAPAGPTAAAVAAGWQQLLQRHALRCVAGGGVGGAAGGAHMSRLHTNAAAAAAGSGGNTLLQRLPGHRLAAPLLGARPLLLLRPPPPPPLASSSTAAVARPMATRVEQQQAANPGLKFWRPTSPGQRGRVTVRRTGIWKGRPMRCLSRGVPRISGRNARGRITVRHRGGGAKRRLRLVDFNRAALEGLEGVVERLEYDPNRTGYIALVRYPPAVGSQPSFGYMLAPQDLSPGDAVASGAGAPIKPGNTLPLADIPVGMPVNSIELHPGQGGVLCRAAGCMATIVNKQATHAIVRLPSGEQRLIHLQCRATVGAVSNPQNRNRVLGKAGASRHLGIRPTVRGVAMNSVDHPMGGGTAGGRPSCSPWGLHAKGKKTRDKHKPSSRWILQPRGKRSSMRA